MNSLQRTLLPTLCTLALLQGCAQPFGEIDGLGRGAVISQKTIDNEPRPPKQIVFRYDDHRYIENDPSGGFVGNCQAETYYVDEKLGVRTKFGGNRETVPRGVFKVEGKAPFIIARDEDTLYISFDEGRKFERMRYASFSLDISVIGEAFYLGVGGMNGIQNAFKDSYIGKFRYDKDLMQKSEKFDVIARAENFSDDPDGWERMRSEIGEIAGRHHFRCDRNLPWRPSVNRERENLKQQKP